MTELNIKESELVADVREINDEIVLNKGINSESNFLFFGNLDVQMKEIDAAVMHAPIHIGDVVVKNVCDTGVDVVATREVAAV